MGKFILKGINMAGSEMLPKNGTSVNLFINESGRDSGVFRLNFYECQSGYPGKKLGEKNVVQKKEIKEGWLKFDISDEQMYLKGDVAVGVEFFPSKGGDIKYEVKLGGTTKTFVRTSSQGQWQTPPHHYRLFITALTSVEKNEHDEEFTAPPSKRMYSKAIDDSFSVFVSLPRNYAGGEPKKYPVIYMLDANVYFDPLCEYLAKKNKQAILVGIGYGSAFEADSLRERDYTYPKGRSI